MEKNGRDLFSIKSESRKKIGEEFFFGWRRWRWKLLGILWKFDYYYLLFHVFVKVVTFICQIFLKLEISFLWWTRWKLLGIPWKSAAVYFSKMLPELVWVVICICQSCSIYLSELFHTYIFHSRGRHFFSWVNSLEAPWHSLEIRPQKICGLGTPPAYFPRSRLFWTAQKQNATSGPEKASSSLPST